MSSLGNIDHFVVLMLENRSFDHMFGFRPGVDGLAGTETQAMAGYTPLRFTADAPWELSTKRAQGPLHNVVDVNLQLFGTMGGPMQPNQAPSLDGFAQSYYGGFKHDVGRPPSQDELAWITQCFAPGALPAITALADNFVLCDRWFCEVPGPTHPNRLYVHAGTSAGYAHNVWKNSFNLLTIYELLQQNGQTWATYAFDDNEVLQFSRLQQFEDSFRHFDPQFQADCDNGKLANYSFVIPRFNSSHRHQVNSQHAPHDVRYGDLLIQEVYGAMRNSPLWEKSALIVTYDEHGGFPDHVAPPTAPNPDGINSPRPDDHGRTAAGALPVFDFDRLGLRVPALIASPWVGKNKVVSAELRHTSILRTVRERFGITRDLGARESSAGSLAAIFDQAAARADCPADLPRIEAPQSLPPESPANPGNSGLDELQVEKRDGVIARTRVSHPTDEDSVWAPKTQAETHDFVRQRLATHREYVRKHPYA